jgi:23S rRNA G2069 N7-methylase RlmK/C1962 C5-methylase RlmI
VDSSAAALSLAASNAALNGVADRATFVREDITPFLKAELDAGNQWDIVVLDPPKLAPNKASLKVRGERGRACDGQDCCDCGL